MSDPKYQHGSSEDGWIEQNALFLERAEKAEAEVERLKEMVMETARKGDELLELFRLRAEKAEAEAIQSKAQLNQALAIATEAHEVIGQFFRGIDYTRIGMEIYELKLTIK